MILEDQKNITTQWRIMGGGGHFTEVLDVALAGIFFLY